MKYTILLLIALVAFASSRSYPLYKQCDSRWSNEILGTGSKTICQAGCLMSSVAMSLSAIGQSYTPGTLNTWLKGNSGFQGNLFVWGSVGKLGLTFSGFTGKNFKSAFDSGKVVILNVRNGAHWVLMTGYSGDTIQVNDPGYQQSTYSASEVVDSGSFNAPAGKLEQTMQVEETVQVVLDEFIPAQEIFDDRFDRQTFRQWAEPDEEITLTKGLLQGSCTCDNIQKMVADAEGTRPCVYIDTMGHPTIGIGFNLDRSDARSICSKYGINYDAIRAGTQCLTSTQITDLFNSDLQWASAAPGKYISGWSSKPTCVQNVLIDMTFNMGANFLSGWPNFVKQVSANDFAGAANNMAGTAWCGQVKSRCTRDVSIMRSCA